MNAPRTIILELQQARLLRAVYSQRQLYEIMVDFWSNHFNIFAAKGADRWLTTSYDRDTIRPHALGKFRDLLLATARSPAMLFYLDNWLSVSPDGGRMRMPANARRRGLNENYARELMELHTLGVEGAYPQTCARWRPDYRLDLAPDSRAMREFHSTPGHDSGAKTVLGTQLHHGGGGVADASRSVYLARHPPRKNLPPNKLAAVCATSRPASW